MLCPEHLPAMSSIPPTNCVNDSEKPGKAGTEGMHGKSRNLNGLYPQRFFIRVWDSDFRFLQKIRINSALLPAIAHP